MQTIQELLNNFQTELNTPVSIDLQNDQKDMSVKTPLIGDISTKLNLLTNDINNN